MYSASFQVVSVALPEPTSSSGFGRAEVDATQEGGRSWRVLPPIRPVLPTALPGHSGGQGPALNPWSFCCVPCSDQSPGAGPFSARDWLPCAALAWGPRPV